MISHLPLLSPRCSFLLLAWILAANPALAQDDVDIERVLFEAEPLAAPPPVPGFDPFPLRQARSDATDSQAPPTLLPTDSDAEEAIARYLEVVAVEEAANGPFAPDLLDPFLSLGHLYQQQEDHEAALEAFGKAEYISRINNGLYAPEQFEIVEAMVHSHFAIGDLRAANERQQYLLFIQQQYFGEESVQVVPALDNLGNWNMDAFRSLLNQHNDSGFPVGLNTRAGGSNATPNPRVLAFGNLYLAQRSYYQAIVNLVQERRFRDPMLPQLELQLIEAIFLAANREGILEDPDFYMDRRRTRTGSRISRDNLTGSTQGFINGRNAWTRMRIYLENDPAATPVEVASAIIGLGDWHMLFNRRQSALDYYQEARTFLLQHDVPEATISALLSPAVPSQLPDFTPLPHSRGKFGIAADTPVDYDGYLDIRFSITRYGNVRDLEVLEKTGNVNKALERRLLRLVRSTPFRPRMEAGELQHRAPVTLRYHFAMIDP